jgi:hypothetical protein
MKLFNNTSKSILTTILLSAIVVSCSEDTMDNINEDKNHTKDVPAKFIMADVITSTAFSNAGGDINTYAAAYVEHEVGTHNQLWRAEHREGEPSSASTFNNVWGNLYSTLKNARIVIEKCSEGGSQQGNLVTKGAAEVMAAYNSALLADMFGDTPWSQAALPAEDGIPPYMNPKIDTQQEIYVGIMQYLDAAIQDLQGSDAHATGPMGSYDLMYGGDKAKWLKFAYGLKARYTMRLLKRSTNATQTLGKVIEYADKSFKSAAEQAAFAIYDASNLNPLFDYQWSRDGLAASKSISEKLIERNDPRIRRVFIDANWVQMTGADDEAFFMAPNGENEQVQYYYNTSAFVFSQTAPTLLLSYHEVLFLKAEALCRLNRAEEARSVLKDAVVAGIANTEINVAAAMNAPSVLGYGGLTETTNPITKAEAESYFETSVKPLFESNPLKETMNQKYLAFFGASGESTECYNDIRRMKGLGENLVTLKNPNQFPLRCPYGNDDTTTNPAVQKAYGNGQYVYTEPVWWAGGTR